MGLFSKKKSEPVVTYELSPIGVYVIDGPRLKPMNAWPEGGSINAIIDATGLPRNQSHVIHTFDDEKIDCIAFKKHTKSPVFVMLKDANVPLTLADITKAIGDIDWDFENSML